MFVVLASTLYFTLVGIDNWKLLAVLWAMIGSGTLCICCYLLAAFAPHPVLGLLGCAVCGFAVGILWPGTFSFAAASMPTGSTAMFALLALAGDLGCGSGPTLVGAVAEAFGDNLKIGILSAIVFPVLLVLVNVILKEKKPKKN